MLKLAEEIYMCYYKELVDSYAPLSSWLQN